MRIFSLCSVASSMGTMTRFMRKRGYKAKNLLNSKKEESVLLLNVRPLTGEHRANPPPQTTTLKKGGARAIGQRVSAAIGRILPCQRPKIPEDDVHRKNDECLNIRQPYIWVPYISKAELDKMMEDKQTQKTPSTNDDQKTVQASTMEDKDIQVTPSTDEDQKPVQMVSMKDKNIHVTPSTNEEQQTAQAATMEDNKTQVTSSTTEDNKTVQASTMEDKDIQVTPSTDEDQKTVQTVSMEDKNIQVTPSTDEEQKTAQAATMEDNETQVSPSTTEDKKTIQASTMEDKDAQVSPSSSEDQKTAEATTIEDKDIQVNPSTNEDQKTIQAAAVEDKETQVTPSTKDINIEVRPSASMDKKSLSLSDISSNLSSSITLRSDVDSLSISSTNHEMTSQIPSASAIDDQSCVLSLETITCYRILGQGTFGMVMLASHPAIDQKLAVKVVEKKKLLQKAIDCQMLFTERNMLKAASESRFITNLFGTFQTKNHLFFVMECLIRRDLFKTMVSEAPFPEDNIRYFIAEMICGLQFLHSKEIIHRDIKPENILLDELGHIKITGFSLSVAGVTESNRIQGRLGTPSYMAPEVLQGFPYFGMADYFSLGVIVYEMKFVKHPFTTGKVPLKKRLEIVLNVEPDYPEDMDINLCDIMDSFLCKDQEERMRQVDRIREHPFLAIVDWKEAEQGKSPPPFPPNHIPEEDLREGMPGNVLFQDEDNETLIEPEKQKLFNGFTYVSERLKLQDKEIEVTPSTNEDQKTVKAAAMEDKETQVTSSTKDNKIEVCLSTSMDKNSSKCRSVEFSKSPSLSSLSDISSILSSSITLSSDVDSFQSSSISSTNHEMASPIPSASAIEDQSCVLSFEKMTCYRMLGEGFYGIVLLASHPAIDQKLAVKIVEKKKLLRKAIDCQMIFIERDVLKAASESRFVTHLFGTFQTKNHLFFVMEYLSRGDLFNTMVSEAPFPEDTIRYFIAEMICGLQFLHSKEIVHRDIKPENILLDDLGHIKITDFGLSVAGVTESNRIQGRLGTPSYMAPEVLQCLPYFGMADFYSLGVIVYEMKFCRHPFVTSKVPLRILLEIVLTVELDFPEVLDINFCDVIDIFLCRDQEERMRQVRRIREHPFLTMVGWKKTEQGKSPPPFPPSHISEEDLSEGVPGNELIQDNETLIEPKKQKAFHGFTYESEKIKLQPVASSPPSKSQDPHRRASSPPLERQDHQCGA